MPARTFPTPTFGSITIGSLVAFCADCPRSDLFEQEARTRNTTITNESPVQAAIFLLTLVSYLKVEVHQPTIAVGAAAENWPVIFLKQNHAVECPKSS